jgi:hypothetical protein
MLVHLAIAAASIVIGYVAGFRDGYVHGRKEKSDAN